MSCTVIFPHFVRNGLNLDRTGSRKTSARGSFKEDEGMRKGKKELARKNSKINIKRYRRTTDHFPFEYMMENALTQLLLSADDY